MTEGGVCQKGLLGALRCQKGLLGALRGALGVGGGGKGLLGALSGGLLVCRACVKKGFWELLGGLWGRGGGRLSKRASVRS